MKETEGEGVIPAEQAEAERYRLLRPAFDRFENRHYLGLAASIALHLAILMGVKWSLSPPPPRPVLVDVDLLSMEPIKARPHYRPDRAQAVVGETRPRQRIKPPAQPKPKAEEPDRQLTMEVVRAAPPGERKRIVKAPGSAPAAALPDASSPAARTSQSVPGPASAATTYQQYGQHQSVKPTVAGAGQQASSRLQGKLEQSVENEKVPVMTASTVAAPQALSPEYRQSSKRKKELSSRGSRQTEPSGGPRNESSQPDRLQASGTGASTLPAGQTQNGARPSVAAASSAVRTEGAAPHEVRESERQSASAAGDALAPDQARAAAGQDRVALASASTSSASAVGSPTEIRSSGGQQASVAGASVGPGQAGAAGSGAAGPALAGGSGGALGKGAPGEEGAVVGLQSSGRGTGGSLPGSGAGAGAFSQAGSGSVRSIEAAPSGSGLQVASAGSGRSIGPAVQSMSAVIVPVRGSAMVSRISDAAIASSMQRVEAQAIAHPIEERYEAKSLKVSSPKTICELPLMLAGFDRKPLPEGLASIMGSESAMVMESPPVLLPGNVQPTYPVAALSGRHEGIVIIRAQVLTNGRVGEVFVRRSSGAALLDQAAMSTVRSWRFNPARRNGDPVSAWVNIPIEYRHPT